MIELASRQSKVSAAAGALLALHREWSNLVDRFNDLEEEEGELFQLRSKKRRLAREQEIALQLDAMRPEIDSLVERLMAAPPVNARTMAIQLDVLLEYDIDADAGAGFDDRPHFLAMIHGLMHAAPEVEFTSLRRSYPPERLKLLMPLAA